MWSNLLRDDKGAFMLKIDEGTLHRGEPPLGNAEKWGANAFFVVDNARISGAMPSELLD